MSKLLFWLLLQYSWSTVAPDVGGRLLPGPPCIPTYRATVCLVKSRPPIPGVRCPADICEDETTFLHYDKLERHGYLDKYPGSWMGPCPGFVTPTMPAGARTECIG